jgi:hypothetical protein
MTFKVGTLRADECSAQWVPVSYANSQLGHLLDYALTWSLSSKTSLNSMSLLTNHEE